MELMSQLPLSSLPSPLRLWLLYGLWILIKFFKKKNTLGVCASLGWIMLRLQERLAGTTVGRLRRGFMRSQLCLHLCTAVFICLYQCLRFVWVCVWDCVLQRRSRDLLVFNYWAADFTPPHHSALNPGPTINRLLRVIMELHFFYYFKFRTDSTHTNIELSFFSNYIWWRLGGFCWLFHLLPDVILTARPIV